MSLTLKPHPDSRTGAVTGLTASVERKAGGRVRLVYELQGDIGALAIPEYEPGGRADELWKHTCFELFVRNADWAQYLEFNLSPSNHWAAYSFSGYRAGMAPVAAVTDVPIGTRTAERAFRLDAELDLSQVLGLAQDAAWQAAVTAIVEAADGTKSYWALAHPQGKPDFHHADGFVLTLPSPEQP